MITGHHSFVRTADPDDAAAMHALYTQGRIRSSLLDSRREPINPNVDELRAALGSTDAMKGNFFAVEDLTGVIQGFCVLRGASKDAAYGEFGLMLLDNAAYATPLAEEVFQFAFRRGFELLRLRKLLAHCLESETAFREYLLAHGFESNGIQRDVFFGQGRWHNLETFSLFAPDFRATA